MSYFEGKISNFLWTALLFTIQDLLLMVELQKKQLLQNYESIISQFLIKSLYTQPFFSKIVLREPKIVFSITTWGVIIAKNNP